MMYRPTPKKGHTMKLLPRWEGPYKILEQVNEVNYRIEMGGVRNIVVHVQKLRKYRPWLDSKANKPADKSRLKRIKTLAEALY